MQAQYGVGPVGSAVIWAELGDTRRFSASRKAVRYTGLDVTVYSSDDKRAPGRLSRQGSPLLRWALYEAAKCAARPGSPDYAYYRRVKDRIGGNRAALGGEEDHSTVSPHPALARRPGPRRGANHHHARSCPYHRCLRPAPAESPAAVLLPFYCGLKRPSDRIRLRDTPSIIM